MKPNESPTRKDEPKGSVAGNIFALALLGCIYFGVKLAYVIHKISETDRIVDTYPSIYAVPTSIMAQAFNLPDARNRNAAILGVLVVVLIVSGVMMKKGEKK